LSINDAPFELQVDTGSDIIIVLPLVYNACGDAVQLYGSVRYWIDEPNLIQFLDENETCQTPTLVPTNAENLVRECSQCSLSTQPKFTTYGPTESSAYLTVTNSHSKESDVILRSPTASGSSMNPWCTINASYGPKHTVWLYTLANFAPID
ncbi:unnamed protein product, partial [Hymenolepis diminuta]